MSYTKLSALDIAQKVQAGELKALDMLEASLAQIQAVDGDFGQLDGQVTDPNTDKKVHAFISLTKDLALAQAEAVDAKVQKGEDAGLLAGVPVSIKDIFALDGTVTTAASRMLHNYRAPYTATAVQKLIDAGALIVGKVNLDEFTFGSSNESSAYQPASNNPWNTAHVPGGSSGGSAAAVAAEETPLSLGTDTGGSIRQPAAFCGVVGLKPSYGRISRYGLIAFASSLDCPGPLARNVPDAALMLQVMAGSDQRDENTSILPVPNYLEAIQQDVKGLRIGLSPDYAGIAYPNPETGAFEVIPVQREVNQAVLDAAECLAKLGAEIVEDVPMPHTRYGIPVYFVVSRIEAASNLNRMDGVKYGFSVADPKDLQDLYRRTRSEGFGMQPKLRILMGAYLSASSKNLNYYQLASQVRAMVRQDFDLAFDATGAHKLDALLTPTTPTSAFKRAELFGDSVLMQYADQMTVSVNHAGLPAVTVPAGLDDAGLPIGIQLIGNDFREDTILRVANAYEQATSDAAWRKIRPMALQEVK